MLFFLQQFLSGFFFICYLLVKSTIRKSKHFDSGNQTTFPWPCNESWKHKLTRNRTSAGSWSHFRDFDGSESESDFIPDLPESGAFRAFWLYWDSFWTNWDFLLHKKHTSHAILASEPGSRYGLEDSDPLPDRILGPRDPDSVGFGFGPSTKSYAESYSNV